MHNGQFPRLQGLATCAMAFAILAAQVGGAEAAQSNTKGESQNVTASAVIKRCDSQQPIGRARLIERASEEGVKVVEVEIGIRNGLTEGKHAVHIHETGACEPCSAAKGHFDPGPNSNTSPDGNHPFHAGDLVNIDITHMSDNVTQEDGTPLGSGRLQTLTTRITLSDGPLSIFDADGSAFIIHVDPDSYCPGGEEAGCAGGARAACGVIVKDAP
ncbi:MAG: superoxide dismutase family protein [Gammaproteobacteria bacterium]|nr:superoxide dismutase family protein [Gammaproteobacteria bacterium]